MTLRAVLDTSVLLSEHRHWLWNLARLGHYEAVWSTFIVGELVRIRVEQAIRHGVDRSVYRRRINDLIHLLSDVLQPADYRSVPETGALRDPDDEPILATALSAGAEWLVTLNVHDFPSGSEVAGVRCLTPQAFLAELTNLHPVDGASQKARGVGRLLP